MVNRLNAAIGISAGLLGLATLAAPAVSAAPGSSSVQTTDVAGDGRVQLVLGNRSVPLGPNQPTADLLGAGARADATTVTFYVKLASAPSLAQLENSNYRYGNTIQLGAAGGLAAGDVTITTDLFVNYESLVYVAGPGSGGLDNGPFLVAGVESVNQAAGEIDYTVNRADLDYAIDQAGLGARPLAAGAQLQVTGATATALGANPVIGNPSDTAPAGPVTTFSG